MLVKIRRWSTLSKFFSSAGAAAAAAVPLEALCRLAKQAGQGWSKIPPVQSPSAPVQCLPLPFPFPPPDTALMQPWAAELPLLYRTHTKVKQTESALTHAQVRQAEEGERSQVREEMCCSDGAGHGV